MKIISNIRLFAWGLVDFLFPRYCVCCGHRLARGEEELCVGCLSDMPRVKLLSFEDNEITRMFWGLVPVQRGASYFHYVQESPYSRILFQMKYYNRPELGRVMGRALAQELMARGFFEGIDLIVPVPLSRKKKRSRGYNQSDYLAWGIAEVAGLEVDTTSVARPISNPSQTHLNEQQRRDNVKGIFSVVHPERLEGRHILLVDDVLTTGATMCSCAETICNACHAQLSFVSLALAGHS